MNTEMRSLLYKAEADYLQHQDLEQFQNYINSLKSRKAVYELLRDKELQIFQPITEEMIAAFPNQEQEKVYQTIKNWVSVMRCCAMAMLLNDPDYLKERILDWLAPQVQAYQLQALDKKLFSLLQAQLQQNLAEKPFALLEPFVEQARQTLVESNSLDPALL